nr:hypothetical protein Iba_chr06aCG1430 [Ipomoea batatas]
MLSRQRNLSLVTLSTSLSISCTNTCVFELPAPGLLRAKTPAVKIGDILPGADGKYPRGPSIRMTSQATSYMWLGRSLIANLQSENKRFCTGRHSFLSCSLACSSKSERHRRVSWVSPKTRKLHAGPQRRSVAATALTSAADILEATAVVFTVA